MIALLINVLSTSYHFATVLSNSYHSATLRIRCLSHLIGHESAGSILSALKVKGWANGLGYVSSPLYCSVNSMSHIIFTTSF